MRNENKNLKEIYSYSDLFFEKGNWKLKIIQILVALVGWIFIAIPPVITTISSIYYISKGRYGVNFWRNYNGIHDMKSIFIILCFCIVITSVFATSMTIIQNNRRESVIEKWPTFDSVSSIERRKKVEKFISKRFSEETSRYNVKYFEVLPQHNLANDELSKVVGGIEKL